VQAVLDYLAQGGFVMPPLVLGAACLWYAIGYRLVTLRRGHRAPVRALFDRYRRGWARAPRGLVDRAVVRAVRLGALGVVGDGTPLRDALDDAFAELEDDARRFAAVVRAVVVAAPLAGLLGTVAGMIETFDALGDMVLFTQGGGIAGGISQALFSTQMGLAVAVPGLLVGRLLDKRQANLLLELEKVRDVACADAGGTPA
jgi:biopolymer transport protein ExbB